MTSPTYSTRLEPVDSAAARAAAVPTQASLAEFYRSRSPELLYASGLDRKRLTLPHAAFECRAAATLRLLRSCPRGTLLDIGCGSGVILCRAAKQRRWTRIVACDLSPDHLAFAEALCAEHDIHGITFAAGDVTDMDLPVNRVDTVLCTEVLEHLQDPAPLLCKLLAHGCRETRYVFSVPYAARSTMNLISYDFDLTEGNGIGYQQRTRNRDSPSDDLQSDASREQIVHWDYAASDFRAILQSCGYEVLRTVGSHYRGNFTHPLVHYLWTARGLAPIARSIARDRLVDRLWWRKPALMPGIAPETTLFLCRAACG
jgi:SAM-dependent methyltransferase